METISYRLGHFEDLLDLLPHLVEKSKINIYDIPIVEITAQYLDYVRHMEREDLNIVSEFLVMAATLLDTKAKMLFPKEVDEKGKEIDPRAELVMRLLGYKECRLIADEPTDREDGALKHFYKPSALSPKVVRYEPAVDPGKLLDGFVLVRLRRVFGQVTKRKEDKIDPIRSNLGIMHREPASPEWKVGSVLNYAGRECRFNLRELLERQPDKLEVVVTFLTALELIEIGKIHLSQEETLGGTDIETLKQGGEKKELDLTQLGDFGE